jgi:hypothetical protein
MLIVSIKRSILYNQWNVVFTIGQSQGLFFFIRNKKKAGQTPINLRTGSSLGVGVIPIGSGPVVNLKLVQVGLPLRYDKARMVFIFFMDNL